MVMYGRKLGVKGIFVKGRSLVSLFHGIGSRGGFSAVGLGRMCHFFKKVMQKTYAIYSERFAQMRRVVGVDAAGAQVFASKTCETFGKQCGKAGAQIYYFALVLAKFCTVQADEQQSAFHKAALPARAARAVAAHDSRIYL